MHYVFSYLRYTNTRVLQKVLLCTIYYIISNAYPYLVYSNLLLLLLLLQYTAHLQDTEDYALCACVTIIN